MTESTETKAVSVLEPALKGVSTSRAAQIEALFVPMVQTLKEFEAEHQAIVDDAAKEITEDVVERATACRKAIARVRIDTEKARVAEKKEIVLNGKAIDGVANILKFAVTEKEDQLKEIENHAEIMERERLQLLRDQRGEALEPYTDGMVPVPVGIETWDEDVWSNYFAGVKKSHEDKLAAEKKAEEDRIAAEQKAAEEAEAQRLENIRLKEEAHAKEQELKKQQEQQALIDKKRAEEQAKKDEQAKKELAATVAKAKKEQDAINAKADKQHKADEKKRLALQAEMNKIAAEQKKKEDHEKALAKAQADHEKALAKASDAERLKAFKEDVLKLYYAVPEIKDTDLKLEIRLAIKAVGELCK